MTIGILSNPGLGGELLALKVAKVELVETTRLITRDYSLNYSRDYSRVPIGILPSPGPGGELLALKVPKVELVETVRFIT